MRCLFKPKFTVFSEDLHLYGTSEHVMKSENVLYLPKFDDAIANKEKKYRLPFNEQT